MKQSIVVIFSFALLHYAAHGAPNPFLGSLLSSGAEYIKGQVQKGADAVGKVMTLGNTATQLGTSLTGKATYMGTSIGKVGLSSATTLGEQAINGGIGFADKGLDLVNSLTGNIPLLGAKVQLGTGIGKWGLSLGQSVGKNVLDLTNSLGLGGLSTANTMVQLTTGAVGNVANAGFGLGKKGADAGAKLITSKIDKGVDTVKGIFVKLPEGQTNNENPGTTVAKY